MYVLLAVLGGFLLGKIYAETRCSRRSVALRHLIRAYHG